MQNKTYATLIDGTKKSRETLIKSSIESVVGYKHRLTKTIAASIDTGDCKQGNMLKYVKELTGKNLREDCQGVYEMIGVFQAVIAGKIDMSEDEFDSCEHSKLSLLMPFINKEELQPKLAEAVQAVKDGKTAKEIRELKGKREPKPSKREKELLETIEKMKAEKSESPERSDTPIESALIVTDIAVDAPILTSRQVLERLIQDIDGNKDNEEALSDMVSKLGKAMVRAAIHADIDGAEWVQSIYSDLAKDAKPAKEVIAA